MRRSDLSRFIPRLEALFANKCKRVANTESYVEHNISRQRHILAEGPPVHNPTPDEGAAIDRRNYFIGAGLLSAAAFAYYSSRMDSKSKLSLLEPPDPTTGEHLVNWSGTHEVTAKALYQPETLAQLEALVRMAHNNNKKLRCIGSGLSPNGIGFQEEGMLSLALMDKVLSVDTKSGLVRVQAGARVQEVADQLKVHGLTLQNYASIREQTIGGFIQVSAHGTGAAIPPVDEQVVSMKLVTPALGTLELSSESHSELFNLARVSLGALGVVAEVTLQCVPAHKLLETTHVFSAAEIERGHAERLKANKHLRYMWIPYTDSVVVVTNNELQGEGEGEGHSSEAPQKHTYSERLAPLRQLLQAQLKSASSVESLSATQLRDALLAIDPLNQHWIAKINKAEAEYWKMSQGDRVGWSDELLGFDCGGQQWVLEVAFPSGTQQSPDLKDLQYMKELLKLIEQKKIPAPAPIEQRWSAGTSSVLSPAHGSPHSLHSWIGIIMYLPEDELLRSEITKGFKKYVGLVQKHLMKKYNAVEHWAKIEVPEERGALDEMKARLKERYPVEKYNAARKKLDPNGILSNHYIDILFEQT